ncbi:MAG: iron-sulfur cluster assembly scaffold protein [Candidatus Margulisbacteria bacterium]|nr:iron-sulfur cluster assembly scaffold protein [Candidatus Margulisiibacteriota bacterium]
MGGNQITVKTKPGQYYGRMNCCDVSAVLRGPCGDEIEIYMDITNNIITDIKVFTTGCRYTKICALALAELACKKTIYEAMDISAKNVLDTCATPADHAHCNILAVSVLYRAIALYLMEIME